MHHPNVLQLLANFNHSQLPPHLRAISAECHRLAHAMVDAGLEGPELTAGLRKLLEAKDCFVRAKLPADRAIEWPPGHPMALTGNTVSP